MEKTQLELIKEKARLLKPMLRIGKSGLNEGMISEITLQLKKKKILKVKLLKASFENTTKKELTERIVKETGSTLIKSIGNIITLYRR